MSGQRFFIENSPRSRAGRTFRPKIDLAHERGALSGRKQISLMSEVYCMDCFNIPHMSAVHFHALQCPAAPVRGTLFVLRQAIAR